MLIVLKTIQLRNMFLTSKLIRSRFVTHFMQSKTNVLRLSNNSHKLKLRRHLFHNTILRRSFMTSRETGGKSREINLKKVVGKADRTRITPTHRGAALATIFGVNGVYFIFNNTVIPDYFEYSSGLSWSIFGVLLNFFVTVPALYTLFAVSFPAIFF